MERRYAEWWEHWCTGPDAVIDPMHIQTPSFRYFPEDAMFDRLRQLNREDQVEDLERRLTRDKRSVVLNHLTESRI